MNTELRQFLVSPLIAVAVALAACGGGDGGTSSPPPAESYTVGGTVTGLTGTGLVLRNNGGGDLGVSADGSFTFATAVAAGSRYDVAVSAQPTDPWQTCAVDDGSGTVVAADVTDILVTCTTNAYTVGGGVTGLNGSSGLVLQNNGGDDLAVSQDGVFMFATPVSSGNSYSVTVATQPAGATCTVNDGQGTVAGEDVASVAVTCSALAYTIGGSVSGLIGAGPSGLVLRNNGTDLRAIDGNGPFTFDTALAGGASYLVAVAVQPANPPQTCTVADAVGSVGSADVTDVTVECFAPDTTGSLDTSFDDDGIALLDVAGLGDYGRAAVIVQPDDKILVAGYANTGSGDDFALARFNADGSPDPGFGSNGVVTTNIGGGHDRALAVAVQPADGKIVVAGYAHIGTGWDFAVARYHPDGTPDASFNGGDATNLTGTITTDVNGPADYGQAVAIQPDGKIVVAGYTLGARIDFALARYLADGALDTSFNGGDPANTGGTVTTDFHNRDDIARAVAIQSDGASRIVVAGHATTLDGTTQNFALARYNDDGSLDTTFGANADGKVTTDFGGADAGRALVVQAGGEIVVAGDTSNGVGNDFALARYTAAGALDIGFDGDGKAVTDIGGAGDEAHGLTLDAGGRLVAVGRSFNGIDYDFAVARYTPSCLDPTFAGAGTLATPVGGGDDEAYGVAVQPDGRIVAVGHTVNGSHTDFALIRVHP